MLDVFISHLLTNGRVTISPGTLPASLGSATDSAILALDQRVRLACPGNPPSLDPVIARTAFSLLYRACQLLTFRDLEIGPVPVIPGSGPTIHWSVDLAFSHLPVLWRQAHERAAADPLVLWITDLVRPWPLSAAGIPMSPAPDPSSLFEHPSLVSDYLDRCLSTNDTIRLAHPRVRSAAREVIGVHPEILSSSLAAAILESQT